jgi:hypothetical protein
MNSSCPEKKWYPDNASSHEAPPDKASPDEQPLDEPSPGQTVSGIKCPLDKVSPGKGVPVTKRPLGDGQSVPDFFTEQTKRLQFLGDVSSFLMSTL